MCSNTLNYLKNVKCKTIKLYYFFTFYISYTCVECGKDVMSYFASSSSLHITCFMINLSLRHIQLYNFIFNFVTTFGFTS